MKPGSDEDVVSLDLAGVADGLRSSIAPLSVPRSPVHALSTNVRRTAALTQAAKH